jgi:hypothetical protein
MSGIMAGGRKGWGSISNFKSKAEILKYIW